MHRGELLIDKNDFVLVVVDIQERLAAAMEDHCTVVTSAVKLIRLAALVGAPIIVTRQYPEGLGANVPEIDEALLGAARAGARVHALDKTAFCCSSESAFVEALESTGRHQAVVLGMETHICVTQTALALAEAGHRVHVPADVCCSRNVLNHEISLDRMRAGGVQVTTSESVMYEAVAKADTDEFRALLKIVKD